MTDAESTADATRAERRRPYFYLVLVILLVLLLLELFFLETFGVFFPL